jgi:hypothetical protein
MKHTRYDERTVEKVSPIRGSRHQGDNDLRLSDDALIGRAGSEEEGVDFEGRPA